jgi:hypothetical protein
MAGGGQLSQSTARARTLIIAPLFDFTIRHAADLAQPNEVLLLLHLCQTGVQEDAAQ